MPLPLHYGAVHILRYPVQIPQAFEISGVGRANVIRETLVEMHKVRSGWKFGAARATVLYHDD